MHRSVKKQASMFKGIRKLFPVTGKFVYLNHAAVSPIPKPVALALKQQVDEQLANGGRSEDLWEERAENARKEAAKPLGARPGEIAFVTNTTQGLNFVARGIRWKTGRQCGSPES